MKSERQFFFNVWKNQSNTLKGRGEGEKERKRGAGVRAGSNCKKKSERIELCKV